MRMPAFDDMYVWVPSCFVMWPLHLFTAVHVRLEITCWGFLETLIGTYILNCNIATPSLRLKNCSGGWYCGWVEELICSTCGRLHGKFIYFL